MTDAAVLATAASVTATDATVIATGASVTTTDPAVFATGVSVDATDAAVLATGASVTTTDAAVLATGVSVTTTDAAVLHDRRGCPRDRRVGRRERCPGRAHRRGRHRDWGIGRLDGSRCRCRGGPTRQQQSPATGRPTAGKCSHPCPATRYERPYPGRPALRAPLPLLRPRPRPAVLEPPFSFSWAFSCDVACAMPVLRSSGAMPIRTALPLVRVEGSEALASSSPGVMVGNEDHRGRA
jgi:hypothetical protein